MYSKPFGVKLPPYFDMVHFKMAADVLNDFENVVFLTCCNSIGNGLVINDETSAIKPKGGFGGIGGLYIKPTALANVRMFSKLCPDKYIIGCGGVRSGRDLFEHILWGKFSSSWFSIHYEGLDCFDRILRNWGK